MQGEVEEALRRVLHLTDPPGLVVAGRTDAGVHARGQVAHADLPGSLTGDLQGLVRRLSGVLPADVRLTAVTVAPDGFDARFSPLWRRYAYRIGDADWGVDPLHRGHVLWYPRRLDVDAMNDAAAPLVGEHDFAAFCRRRPGATTIRRLLELSWARRDGLVVARVVADAFCHTMVRSLVGAFLAVGEGRRPVEWPAEVLARGLRDSAVHVVRPHGLTLEEVAYPPDGDLAARAAETRRRRTPPV